MPFFTFQHGPVKVNIEEFKRSKVLTRMVEKHNKKDQKRYKKRKKRQRTNLNLEESPIRDIFVPLSYQASDTVWDFVLEFLRTGQLSNVFMPFLLDYANISYALGLEDYDAMIENLEHLPTYSLESEQDLENLDTVCDMYNYQLPEHVIINALHPDLVLTNKQDLVWDMRTTWKHRFDHSYENTLHYLPAPNTHTLVGLCPLFQLQFLKPEKVVLAGGSLLYLMLPNIPRPSDIDIWVQNQAELNRILKLLPEGCLFEQYGSIINVSTKECKIPLQLVCSTSSPFELIRDFDLDYLRCYYDGSSQVALLPECLLAWKTKTVTYCSANPRKSRLLKAAQKGFHIADHVHQSPLDHEFKLGNALTVVGYQQLKPIQWKHLKFAVYNNSDGCLDDGFVCSHKITIYSTPLLDIIPPTNYSNWKFVVSKATNQNNLKEYLQLSINGNVVDDATDVPIDIRSLQTGVQLQLDVLVFKTSGAENVSQRVHQVRVLSQ